MVFSDTTTDGGILQESRWLVGANSTSYNVKDVTRNVNRWFDRAVSLIYEADGRWQWDDHNQSAPATYTDNLVSGTQSYAVLSSHLKITRAEVKDPNGNWKRLKLIDQNDITDTLNDFQATDGTPVFYDLIGEEVFLYPAPNYASTGGLKLYFQRGPSYFTIDNTTKEPGFASIFHRYLSLGAALDYATKNNMDSRSELKQEILEMEQSIKDFYFNRAKDEAVMFKVKQKNYR